MVAAYLFGSVPTGKLVAARYGIDIQKKGSGNIGFANVYREVGKRPALIVLIVDMLKGALSALLIMQYVQSISLVVWLAFAATIGHVFPVWLNFRGGKGVATTLGILLIALPVIGLLSLGIYAVILTLFRKFPLASLGAALGLPLLASFVETDVVWFCTFLALFCFWTHRSNITTLVMYLKQSPAP